MRRDVSLVQGTTPATEHDLEPLDSVHPRRRDQEQRAGGVSADLPLTGACRARSGSYLGLADENCAGRAERRQGPARGRGHRHHESARDHRSVVARLWQAGGQRDRLAEPYLGADL